MTITEAAKALGLHRSTLHTQVLTRRIKAHKMGGRWYVTDAEVERYRSENRRRQVDAS